ncbi:hypothetical protein CON36_36855 [Bacillus cereus]|uniref:Zinc-ribbon domain-containing protein n=1 Tax=Bacillus cereus TaxID=1396 RepID=A0A9X6SRV7_BACCE|nr:hypothetical protein [Bacillus cereus]PDZ93877.1 hypothetical protein CON36_36855 [Bacillus cereus]PGP12638.1 hypothetical protein COA01_33005 [Bacillus cereus]
MCTTEKWYESINEKYIRDKERFIKSMEAMLDTPRAFKSRTEKAAEDNLKYLCRDIKTKHNAWYKLPCGHIKMISNGDFYKKVFHCYGCDVLLWEKEAEEKDMTFIKKIDGEKALYQLNECKHSIVLGTSHVRKYKNRYCEECHIEELKSIADSRGLDFIEKADGKSRKAVYRFRQCGHTHTLYTHHVKKEGFSCQTCNPILNKRMKALNNKGVFIDSLDEEQFDKSMVAQMGKATSIEKWTREATEKDLTFLCRDKDIGNFGWYKLPCSHIKRISIVNIRNCKDSKNIICPYCLENSRIQSAKEKGLELLQVLNGDKALYRFEKCGHTREVYISDVERNNQVLCHECVVDKWKKEAKEANLTFIEKTENKKALYKCNCCETLQEFYIIAVRNKEFICKGCKEKQ